MDCAILSHRQWVVFALVAIFVLVCSGGTDPASALDLTPISGLSPYPDGGDPDDPFAVTACNGAPQHGVVYRNSETEPYIAVNPMNSDNMIAAWHQDRWSTGSAQGVLGAYTFDGGATWTPFNIPFSRCAGAAAQTAGDYERATDPWITFGPDGAAYYMSLSVDHATSRNGMVVAKSVDGGVTWADPVMIKDHDARGVNSRSLFHDKNSMTADPHDPNLVYSTWTLFRNGTLALLFSRSTDGGMTWEAARPVNKFEKTGKHEGVAFRQGSQIVVLPDGTLLNAFYRGLIDRRGGGQFAGFEQAIFRSHNQGKHWERLDTPVADMAPTGAIDIEYLISFDVYLPVRDAGQIPDIAVDDNSGNLYMVWQDGRYSEFGTSSVVISRSTDGGDSWSQPIPVHDVSDPFNQAFLPAVTVAEDGTVGVLFYDFRNDEMFVDTVLSTDVFLTMLDPDLNILSETRVTDASFDMRQMLITGNRGYFPGDYVGLDAAGNDFVAAFTVANNLGLPVEFPQDNSGLKVDNNNRQDIVFARVPRANLAKTGIGASILPNRSGSGNSTKSLEDAVLIGNSPNPFNPQTTIAFELRGPQSVRLEVFDVTGRVVRTLIGGDAYPAGRHDIAWDGHNDRGQAVASGVYLYRLRAGDFADARRMMLMK